jgi:hypothetical protein
MRENQEQPEAYSIVGGYNRHGMQSSHPYRTQSHVCMTWFTAHATACLFVECLHNTTFLQSQWIQVTQSPLCFPLRRLPPKWLSSPKRLKARASASLSTLIHTYPTNGPVISKATLSPHKWTRRVEDGPSASKSDPITSNQTHCLEIGPVASRATASSQNWTRCVARRLKNGPGASKWIPSSQ